MTESREAVTSVQTYCQGWVRESGLGFQTHSRPCTKMATDHRGDAEVCGSHARYVDARTSDDIAGKWASPERIDRGNQSREFYL